MSDYRMVLAAAAERGRFEERAFWTLKELLGKLERPGVSRWQLRRWLRAADAVTENAAGVAIVTRADLEGRFPELLDELRRQSAEALVRDSPR